MAVMVLAEGKGWVVCCLGRAVSLLQDRENGMVCSRSYGLSWGWVLALYTYLGFVTALGVHDSSQSTLACLSPSLKLSSPTTKLAVKLGNWLVQDIQNCVLALTRFRGLERLASSWDAIGIPEDAEPSPTQM